MTNEYRKTQLENAQKHVDAARNAMNNATTKAARRDAADELEFWTNKTAFLSHAR